LLIIFIRDGAAYFYLILLALRKQITTAEFLLFFVAINQFVDLMGDIYANGESMLRGGLQIADFREYISIKDTSNRGKGLPVPRKNISIQCKDVFYFHPKADSPTIRHLNLVISPGENVAIVGNNGAGKTTFVKLLCGFYKPTQGSILVNEREINNYNRDEYFGMIAAVFQDFQFLPLSVKDNVSNGEYQRQRFEDSIGKSQFDSVVDRLSDRENTCLVRDVSPDAIDLSDGESQRLALARALYKDSPLLILDEPSAALDPIAESLLYQDYSEFSKDKTCIFISHRLASTKFCDRILFMKDGEITEEGTHEELLQINGAYAELYRVQSQYYQ
jgi:ABC-type multidrug transport system fused ATPase/permease subunit